MQHDFRVDSWSDLAVLATVFGALFTALGIAGSQFYVRLKNKREQAAADDEAANRLIDLIKKEADKRVEIVRAEFELRFAELKLEHARELTAIRQSFEEQLAEIRAERRDFHCENAPTCSERVPPGGIARVSMAPGGTD